VKRYVVGLTGGIGSGKSAVARLFAERGADIVDTDAIAHDLTAPRGAAIEPIAARFGRSAIAADGALDRAAMRSRVFSDVAAKRQLEAILHPLIRARSDRLIAQSKGPYVVLVVPLLVESGADPERYQRIVVVDCPDEVQVARVMARSGLQATEVRAIMATQASRSDRLARADDVVDNGGALENLTPQVERLHRAYLALAEKFSTSS
jgi:dephospho-CoA kinase